MGIKHTKVAGGVDNPAYDVSKGEWNDDHDISTLDILDIETAETDDSLVLAPDGAGGVEFRAEAGGGGGGVTDADYLVGTSHAGLSAEIVVGTTPGGELGGTWGSPTVDATHSGSAHHSAVTVGTGLDITGQDITLDLSEVSAGGELGGTMDAPTVDATHSGSTHAATQSAAEATAASALSTHAAAADPHTGYLKESVVSAMAAPGLTLGTTNAAGVATTVLATDSTILAFDATGPAAVGTQAVGAATVAARRDHVHATGAGTPSTQAFGDAAAAGSGPAASMTDHKHAMPADPVTAHAAASDPHTGYVLESLLDAKGDLIAASADNTPAKVTVGADDTILMADAAAGAGLKWVAAGTPSTQAFGDSAVVGTSDTFTRGDHKHAMPAAPTTIANDTLWAAAGDLAVASGNDAAAVLSKGAAGGALSIVNSAVAWNSGTSFPGSKATGDRYWRTDLGLEAYWDGAQWLTTQLFQYHYALSVGLSASNAEVGDFPLLNSTAIWIVDWRWSYVVGTTHDAGKYWTSTLTGYTSGTSFSTLTTDKATANLMVNPAPTAIGALATTSDEGLYIIVTKVSTPSNLTLGTSWAVRYRLVLT